MKKTTTQTKKLKLSTITVRGLSDKNLKEVVGGATGSHYYSYCPLECPTG
jgi:hypothetical protein